MTNYFKLKSVLQVASVAAFAVAALAVPDSKADHPKGTGGKFTVHMNRDIGGFDHIRVPQGGMGRYQVIHAVQGLPFSMDNNGKLIPNFAVKLTHSDDFKVWRMELRKGVRAPNGKELTAETYTHHFGRLLGSRLAGRFKALLGADLQKVVGDDKYTVAFHFGRVQLAMRELVSDGGLYIWFMNETSFAKANEKKPDYNRMSMGFGPYMVKSWIPGKGVTMVRNPNYWNPKAQHADEIFYRITTGPEGRGLWNAMRAGDIDVAWTLSGGIVKRAQKNKNLTVLLGHRKQLHFSINFQMHKNKALANNKVRLGLTHAIDRKAIIRIAMKGVQKFADQSFPPGNKWHCDNVNYPAFDLAKAKALLKGIDVPPIDLWTYNIPTFKKIAVMIQDMWKKVGVKANVKVGGRGPTGVVGKIVKGNTPAYMVTRGSYVHPTVFDMKMMSTAKDNEWRVKSPKLDAAIKAVQAARGDAAIKKAHCAFERAKTEVLPYMPFGYAIAGVVFQKDIGGMKAPNDGILGYHNLYRIKK
jgi:ABC-type transport system substrate-binding protein